MTDGIALPPSATDMAQLLLGQSSGSISLGKAEIIEVPSDLSGQTVQGEVVTSGKDGTVTVQTQTGEQVTLKPKVPLAVGQKVAVEIPPENPTGQTVTVKLASSASRAQTGQIATPSAPPPAVVEDTVSPVIQNRANVTLQTTADTVQLGKPVRAILFETPIRFNNEMPTSPPVSTESASGINNGIPLSNTMQQPMSIHEILQQVEGEFITPVSPKNDILLQQFVQRNIMDKNDTLIRMVLGLQDNGNAYKPLSPLQEKNIDLPILNKSFSTLNTQTSILSLRSSVQNIAMQHVGVDLPDLMQVIKAFQGNVQSNLLATNLLNNENGMVSDIRFVQVQNLLGSETATATATTPQMALKPLEISQSFFTVGKLIDADMPDNTILRVLQNPMGTVDTLNALRPREISVKPQLLQALFVGHLSAKTSFMLKDGPHDKMITVPNLMNASLSPSSFSSANGIPAIPQEMGLWATPMGIFAMPMPSGDAIEIGQNAIIQIDTTNGLSTLIKPVLNLSQPVSDNAVTGITNDIPALDSVLSSDWPALQQTIEALFDVNVALARSFMANIPMPSAPPQFTPAVIFFLAALRVGNLKAWTGEKMIDALERAGKGDLVKRLSGDFAHASARSKEPLADGWRPFHIPILYDENLSRLQCMVRQDEEDSDGTKKVAGKKSTRFLIDLVLSRIGDVQLDGYIRGKNLDMIVRTKKQLSSDIQQNIRQRFSHAVDMTGLNGSIRMFGRGEGWVKVERPSGASGVRV